MLSGLNDQRRETYQISSAFSLQRSGLSSPFSNWWSVTWVGCGLLMLGEQWVKFCVFWDAAVFTVFELGSGAIFISCLFNNSEEGFT